MNLKKCLASIFLGCLIFLACTDSDGLSERTYFRGVLFDQYVGGSGVVFLELNFDQTLIRILSGHPWEYHAISISLDSQESGTYMLKPGKIRISLIVGRDALAKRYEGKAGSDNYITFEHSEGYFSGDFFINVTDEQDKSSIVKGVFNLEASTSTNWDCDFNGSRITDCFFFD